MKHILNYIKKVVKKITPDTLLVGLILIVFLINAFYVSYPDEFVNLLGGQFINQGKIPYSQFFDHHLALAWYLAAIILRFSFHSYVLFRFFWALFIFSCLFWLSRYLKNNKKIYPYYQLFFFLYPFLAVYYWLHLYLADSLASLFFAITFWLLINESTAKKINQKIIYITSLTTFAFVFSSLGYIYIAIILYLWEGYLIFKKDKKVFSLIKLALFSLLPYLFYFLYLLLSHSLKDFYIANFVYNTKLYINIPNYTMGRHFNPLKFALTLIFNFYQNYLPALTALKDFNLYFPIASLCSLGTLLFLLVLIKKNWPLAILYFFILSFSAPRSNVRKLAETNYQAGLYIVLSLSSAILFFYLIKEIKLKDEIIAFIKKLAAAALVIYLFFSAIFLIKNTYDKFYLRYTQKMPGIYDLSDKASFIDGIINQGDYYWIGPYEPHHEFFVRKGRLPGKYISLLPQFREDKYFRNSFLQQFKNHPPRIIIYKHEASIFMTPSLKFGKFFLQWMKEKYTSIEHIKGVKVLRSPSSFNLATDLYLRNDQQETLIQKLLEKGWLKHS